MSQPMFEFDLRIAEADSEGYYYTRWDLAHVITVTGATKDEAFSKGFAVLGDPRRGRYWTGVCDKIREVKAND